MSDTSLVFNILAKDKASAVFNKMKGTALVAGAAIGAALAAGAAQMLEKSKLDGVLAAQLGASPGEAAALGKLSGQVFAAGFGEDMPGVSMAIKTAAQNGLIDMARAGDEASKATVEKLLTVSQVVGAETERVSAAVSTMLKTGMAGSAEEAFDMITKATQAGVNKSGDLIDTLEEYPTLFRSLGLTGPQSLGLINQGLQAGARNADQVADGLKELGIRAIDGSTAARGAYQLLGLDADAMIAKIAKGGPSAAKGMDQILDRLRAMKDPVKQNEAGVGLLGTKWEDMRDAVLSMDLDSAAAQMDGLNGATAAAGRTIQETAGAKLERFKRQAQMALVDQLAKAVPYIESTFGWLSRNSGWVGPLATGLGVLAAVIGTIVLVTKIWTAVQTALNVAMAMNPVGLVVLAVAALIAIIVLIATKTTWFQSLWNTVWGAIKAVVEWVVNWIVGGWKWAFGILSAGVSAWWSVFSGAWRKVGEFGRRMLQWVVDKAIAFNRFMTSMPGKVAGKLRSMFDPLKSGFRNAINWIIGRWNNLSFTIGGGSFLGQSIPSVSFGTPNIPYLAKGGIAEQSGLAVVGERGPELLSLTRGAQVTPLKGAGGIGGPTVLEIRSGGSAFEDLLVEVLRSAIRRRGGNVQLALGR